MTKCSCCSVAGILHIATFICKEPGRLRKRDVQSEGRSWREDSGSTVKGGRVDRRAHAARTARRQLARTRAHGRPGDSATAHSPSGASRAPRKHLGAPLLCSLHLTHHQGLPGLPPGPHLALSRSPCPVPRHRHLLPGLSE